MLFKMLAIQRTWQQYPDMRPKPRQVFVTQSPVLAKKVGEHFVKLTLSFETGAHSLEEPHMLQIGQEFDLIDPDDNTQWKLDLPEKYSDLSDEHLPLFITYDRVRMSLLLKYPISPFREQLCTMLQNDIRPGNDNDGFIIPKMRVLGDEVTSPASPTLPRKSRLHAGSGGMSSSDYTQQFRRNFVSYGNFLASYWDHLPQTLNRALGAERWLVCMIYCDN